MSTTIFTTEASARQKAAALDRMYWGPVLGVSGTLVAVLLILSGRYGYYFDELYYRVAGQHLDWGYVDQPVLIPLLATVQIGPLVDGHLLYTSTVNYIAWVTICWLLLRLLRTRDTRLWLAIGAVAGVGLLGKYLVVVLAVGLGLVRPLRTSRQLVLRAATKAAGRTNCRLPRTA